MTSLDTERTSVKTGVRSSRVQALLGGPRKRAAFATFAATLCNTALVIVQGVVLLRLYVTHVGRLGRSSTASLEKSGYYYSRDYRRESGAYYQQAVNPK